MQIESSFPRSQQSATVVSDLSQPNPIHVLKPYFPKIPLPLSSHLRLGPPGDLLSPQNLQTDLRTTN
jgi:hypothetical protein